jgi:hypothetical protein
MKPATRLPRARIDNLVIRKLGDETLVYDTEHDEAHCLNSVAAMVWDHCDGKTTAENAARSLRTALNLSVDADVVWLAVKQLQRFRLVKSSEKLPVVSRRRLLLKYAPAALALPVIMSISAPAAAQAGTCAGNGQSCVGRPCCAGLRCSGSTNTCVPNIVN